VRTQAIYARSGSPQHARPSSPQQHVTHPSTKSTDGLSPLSEIVLDKAFVLCVAASRSSTIIKSPWAYLTERATRNANKWIFFGSLIEWSRGRGPWMIPPPRQIGLRMLDARARPVPFCLHGFFPPPRTSDRNFAFAVPYKYQGAMAQPRGDDIIQTRL
jgi:hypothetical protein